ncbi:hypothetical protein D3C75_813860 [compost metagenome]
MLPNTVINEIKTEGTATMRKYKLPASSTSGSAPIHASRGSAKKRVTTPNRRPAITESQVDCLAICLASSSFPAPTRLAIIEEVPTPMARKSARYTFRMALETPTAVTSVSPIRETNNVSTNPTTVWSRFSIMAGTPRARIIPSFSLRVVSLISIWAATSIHPSVTVAFPTKYLYALYDTEHFV